MYPTLQIECLKHIQQYSRDKGRQRLSRSLRWNKSLHQVNSAIIKRTFRLFNYPERQMKAFQEKKTRAVTQYTNDSKR